jgi:hypothetical protein
LTPGNGLYEQAGPAKDWTTTAHSMHPDNNLEMLMVRYQQGDFAAAAVLVDRISPQLHRFFAVQFASRPDADDLVAGNLASHPQSAPHLSARGASASLVLCNRPARSRRSL